MHSAQEALTVTAVIRVLCWNIGFREEPSSFHMPPNRGPRTTRPVQPWPHHSRWLRLDMFDPVGRKTIRPRLLNVAACLGHEYRNRLSGIGES